MIVVLGLHSTYSPIVNLSAQYYSTECYVVLHVCIHKELAFNSAEMNSVDNLQHLSIRNKLKPSTREKAV